MLRWSSPALLSAPTRAPFGYLACLVMLLQNRHLPELRDNSRTLSIDLADCVEDVGSRIISSSLFEVAQNYDVAVDLFGGPVELMWRRHGYQGALWCIAYLMHSNNSSETADVTATQTHTSFWHSLVCPGESKEHEHAGNDLNDFFLWFSCAHRDQQQLTARRRGNMGTFPGPGQFCLSCAAVLHRPCLEVGTVYHIDRRPNRGGHKLFYLSNDVCDDFAVLVSKQEPVLDQVHFQLDRNGNMQHDGNDFLHAFGIFVARRMLHRKEDALDFALLFTKFYFSPAVLHGFMWTMVAQFRSSSRAVKWAFDFCMRFLFTNDTSLHILGECVHGFGHGIYRRFLHNRPSFTDESVAACSQALDDKDLAASWQQWCIGGVMMEHMTTPIVNSAFVNLSVLTSFL